MTSPQLSRRQWLVASAAGLALAAAPRATPAAGLPRRKALIAIMLNLEMSRGYPRPEDTRWDFEKGNLDDASRRYTLELAQRLRRRGGVVHAFLVGETLEQPSIDWLKQLLADGHRVGNHTYHHVDIFARDLAKIQPRFTRSPELLEGKQLLPFIREEITRTADVFERRTGGRLVGFRSPSEKPEGIADRPELQQLLKELGFSWVVTKYPRVSLGKPGEKPTPAAFDAVVQAQAAAQPMRYASGIVELPISPITDIHALRSLRWSLEDFVACTRRCVEYAIATGTSFRFTGHPSCLNVVDPRFTVIDAICDAVEHAGGKAAIVGLDDIATTVA